MVTKVISNKSQLPKTGETASQRTGDDGYYQKGSPILPRFIDNGDNTITDRVTNLQWIKQPELIIPDGLNASNIGAVKGDWVSGGPYAAGDLVNDTGGNVYICLIANINTNTTFALERTANPTYWQLSIWATRNGSSAVNPKTMNWNNAVTNSLITKSGKNDWKLPNLKELVSIADYSFGGDSIVPAINLTFFPNTLFDNPWWSSTDYAADPTIGAWYVDFSDGNVNGYIRGSSYYVRPVRQY